jgi:hypothetical protein
MTTAQLTNKIPENAGRQLDRGDAIDAPLLFAASAHF